MCTEFINPIFTSRAILLKSILNNKLFLTYVVHKNWENTCVILSDRLPLHFIVAIRFLPIDLFRLDLSFKPDLLISLGYAYRLKQINMIQSFVFHDFLFFSLRSWNFVWLNILPSKLMIVCKRNLFFGVFVIINGSFAAVLSSRNDRNEIVGSLISHESGLLILLNEN